MIITHHVWWGDDDNGIDGAQVPTGEESWVYLEDERRALTEAIEGAMGTDA